MKRGARGPMASGFQPSRDRYKCPVKGCKSEFRGDDISKHFAKYANLLVLDKAIEDLSNLRKKLSLICIYQLSTIVTKVGKLFQMK